MVLISVDIGVAFVSHFSYAILLEHDRSMTAVMHPGETAFRAGEGFLELRRFSIVHEDDLVLVHTLVDRSTGTGKHRLFRFTDQSPLGRGGLRLTGSHFGTSEDCNEARAKRP